MRLPVVMPPAASQPSGKRRVTLELSVLSTVRMKSPLVSMFMRLAMAPASNWGQEKYAVPAVPATTNLTAGDVVAAVKVTHSLSHPSAPGPPLSSAVDAVILRLLYETSPSMTSRYAPSPVMPAVFTYAEKV